MKSTAYRLIEVELGRDLSGFVADLRERGMSWQSVRDAVVAASGVVVTTQTIHNWFGDGQTTAAAYATSDPSP